MNVSFTSNRVFQEDSMKRTVFLPLLALFYSGCAKQAPDAVTINPAILQLFQPLPEAINSNSNPLTEEKIALGRMLFYETRLSKSHQISCNSCHALDKYGMDNQSTSDGHKGQVGDRNSPTVYNAAEQFVQFWDGRAADVEAQAKGPVMNPIEMAMPSEKQVAVVLKSMPEYVNMFQKAFPEEKEPINYENMAKAIGAFERKLVTPSRWDKLLRGDQSALTNEEKAGFNSFMEAGCQTCHSGMLLGGNMYQKLGLVKSWPDSSDPGREKVTKNGFDHLVFKVPSLRNIEKTKPYYHNGKVELLEDAVARMGEYQLGKSLTPAQIQSIIAWLKTLTGDLPMEYIKPPELPKSTAKTPKPEVD
jgi:cytochrome c peroxidase